MRKILVNDTEIQVIKFEEENYISLTIWENSKRMERTNEMRLR